MKRNTKLNAGWNTENITTLNTAFHMRPPIQDDIRMTLPAHTRGGAVATPSQEREKKIAVIIPCYNEARRLALDAFLNFAEEHTDIHLIFVDDGSKDETLSLLCGATAALPHQVTALVMKQNAGKAEAVRQGLKFAAREKYTYVAFLDADLATPLDAILDFASVADRMDDIDVVFGSRCGGLGTKVHREWHRKIISFICANLGRLATGLPMKDTQCGAKLFRNTEQFMKSLNRPFDAGWLFDVELFLRISHPDKQRRNNFFEYPVLEWSEIPGSKIRSTDVLESGLRMLTLIVNQWKIRRRYFTRKNNLKSLHVQTIRSGAHLSFAKLLDMRDMVDHNAREIVLDLCAVKTTGPSVFTALVDVADHVEGRGQIFKVRMAEGSHCLDQALKTGLSAVMSCTQAPRPHDALIDCQQFDLVEV